MARKPKTPDLDPTQVDDAAPDMVMADAHQDEPAPNDEAASFASAPTPHFADFDAFYEHYTGALTHADNRRLHVVGIGLAVLCLINVVLNGVFGGFWSLVWAAIFAFGFAFAGDQFIEKKSPTLLTHPAWSLLADVKMAFEIVTRKRPW
jgi:hypothetical protein